MALASALNALTMGTWALFLGMLVASYRSGAPARRRGALAVVAAVWLIVAGVQLWHEPAIEPLWLQYLLLLLLPAALGLGFALLAQHFRTSPADPPSRDPQIEEGER
ncbi:hypothetical protein ACIQTT_11865 [Microbacterium sp. NPDC090225]|uniref:hypothetical protein n=1 Tax=Microbacterium sp. NPDC090225 TaxID=3364207 RepID=UPI00381A63AD